LEKGRFYGPAIPLLATALEEAAKAGAVVLPAEGSGAAPLASPELEMDRASFLAGLAKDEADVQPDGVVQAFERRNAGLDVAFMDGEWRSPLDLTAEVRCSCTPCAIPLVRGAQVWARAGSAQIPLACGRPTRVGCAPGITRAHRFPRMVAARKGAIGPAAAGLDILAIIV
jgi:hypothetical protein